MLLKVEPSEALVVRRVLDWPVTVVFRAWTDPSMASKWSWGRKYETISIDLDCRVGGTWRQQIRDKNSGENWFFEGTFREVVPNQKLVHTFHWRSDRGVDHGTSLVCIEFLAKGQRTEIVITHEELPAGDARQGTELGWVDVCECVAACLSTASLPGS
jgi:uncharacterized protein YndB with AHSA1/START domain